jgi:hypothetical protein
VILTKYYSVDQIKKNERGGACGTTGDRIDAYRVLARRPEGKRPLGRHWRRRKDDIKMDLPEVGWRYGLDSCGLG